MQQSQCSPQAVESAHAQDSNCSNFQTLPYAMFVYPQACGCRRWLTTRRSAAASAQPPPALPPPCAVPPDRPRASPPRSWTPPVRERRPAQPPPAASADRGCNPPARRSIRSVPLRPAFRVQGLPLDLCSPSLKRHSFAFSGPQGAVWPAPAYRCLHIRGFRYRDTLHRRREVSLAVSS